MEYEDKANYVQLKFMGIDGEEYNNPMKLPVNLPFKECQKLLMNVTNHFVKKTNLKADEINNVKLWIAGITANILKRNEYSYLRSFFHNETIKTQQLFNCDRNLLSIEEDYIKLYTRIIKLLKGSNTKLDGTLFTQDIKKNIINIDKIIYKSTYIINTKNLLEVLKKTRTNQQERFAKEIIVPQLKKVFYQKNQDYINEVEKIKTDALQIITKLEKSTEKLPSAKNYKLTKQNCDTLKDNMYMLNNDYENYNAEKSKYKLLIYNYVDTITNDIKDQELKNQTVQYLKNVIKDHILEKHVIDLNKNQALGNDTITWLENEKYYFHNAISLSESKSIKDESKYEKSLINCGKKRKNFLDNVTKHKKTYDKSKLLQTAIDLNNHCERMIGQLFNENRKLKGTYVDCQKI